jgi:DNA-binding Lrp family transcriptional regulator
MNRPAATAPDGHDQRIVMVTRSGLALVREPYRLIAEQLGLGVEELMDRIDRMLAAGAIRRIGVVANPAALGYRVNALVVWDVDDDWVDELGAGIGDLPFVSHCYRRPRRLPDWPYNLFAKLHGLDPDQVTARAHEVLARLGGACRAWDILPGIPDGGRGGRCRRA